VTAPPKDKPYDRRERATFVNSDPSMIVMYSAWLDLLDVDSERRRFSVMIHESADVPKAERFWADLVGAGPASFSKTVLKKHNPKTVRKNVGDAYHGCLVINVQGSADLYRRIEGWWRGLVVEAERRKA